MPFLDIRLSAPCLPEKVAQIAAPGHWTDGGESLDAGGGSFFLEANVTVGTSTPAQKAAFVAAA